MKKCTRISRNTAGIISAIVAGLVTTSASAQDACLDQHVTPSDALAFKYFGSSLDAQGDTLIVGAMQDNELGMNAGAAYVFNRIDGEWVEVQKLLASDGGSGDRFSQTGVSIDGNRVAIGAANHIDPDAPAAGAVYVFEHDGKEWVETAKITPSQGNFLGGFGGSVDLHGDDLVVGAHKDDEYGNLSGAAYVFHYDGRNWFEQQKLVASNASGGDAFGIDVAMGDHSILIGASAVDIDHPKGGNESGAVYRFAYDIRAKKWVETQVLMPSDAIGGKQFGQYLAVDADLAVISAHADPASLSDVYVFEFNEQSNNWIEVQKISKVYTVTHGYGRAVDIHDKTIVIGDSQFSALGSPKGAAFVHQPNADGRWIQTALLRPEPSDWSPFFGLRDVAVTADYAVVDATGENNTAGAAYVFDLNPTPGDMNCDGIVNGFDFASFFGEWGPCDICEHCPADVNNDCTVDGADLAILLGNWG